MTSQVVSYALDADTVVQIEVEPTSEWRQVGADHVAGSVDEATRPAVEAAQRVLRQIAKLRPDEAEVSFGIKVSGSANWFIAKTASEANFGVKLVWRAKPRPDKSSDMDGAGAQE